MLVVSTEIHQARTHDVHRRMNKEEHIDQATVLVIDDSPTDLRLLLQHLEKAGFKMLVAPNGERAIQQLKHVTPDLILLDILMPGIDGFETCIRLKQNEATKDIPVIFMTALADTFNKVRGFQTGGVDYITKPFQYEEVIARVNAHLTIRKLQKQLQGQNQQLRELNASKDKFLAIIAHDLESPFSSLRGLIQLTAENIEGYSQDELEKVINLLGNSTDNLHALIENLLTWSRIQRGVMDHQPQEFDLHKAVVRNFELLAPKANEKQITLENLVKANTVVYADFNMVDAVLRNLISNALKFTYSQGKINISATQAEPYVEIAVTDSGIGISRKNIPKLFRIDVRFKRLGTEREKGTGLGLILCKEFVEKNGGKIWIESEEGQGTTFKFTLPKESAG